MNDERKMRNNPDVVATRDERAARPRRGRARKWPTEAARRQREATMRRLRNTTHLTAEACDDIVRLTALPDDLQHRRDGVVEEVEELRWRAQELERRLAEASRPARENEQSSAARPMPPAPPRLSRQERREAERVQRRARA